MKMKVSLMQRAQGDLGQRIAKEAPACKNHALLWRVAPRLREKVKKDVMEASYGASSLVLIPS